MRRGGREQQLRDLERDAAELEIAKRDHTWFVAALRDFAKVWVNMSPENKGRFFRALRDKVVVDEDNGTCRVELIDFGAFVALCTAILQAQNGCRPVLAPDPTWQERLVKEWERRDLGPDPHDERAGVADLERRLRARAVLRTEGKHVTKLLDCLRRGAGARWCPRSDARCCAPSSSASASPPRAARCASRSRRYAPRAASARESAATG